MTAGWVVGLIALGLCGCASQGLRLSTLPPQTPAADLAAATAPAKTPLPLITPADAPSMTSYDPWERGNRFILGRLVINSTVGLGGLIDVARRARLPGAPTGFGTTLGRWGVHPGPLVVLPILRPSTLRDGVGLVADYGTSHAVYLANLYRGNETWYLGGTNAVDERANVDFRYYSTGSPFEYEMIRFLVVHKRLLEDEGLRRPHGGKPGAAAAVTGD